MGLHFLGPSIYPPDPYLTARARSAARSTGRPRRLAADVDAKATLLPVDAAPQTFPAEDGGYEGDGTVLQVGDELIWYGERAVKPPFGFAECRRGHLGTKAAAAQKGDRVVHLVRSYGYHMFDMDTSLLDEVAGHFAKVANACGIDMIYFDGSERLQGDHWYYNARLHKAFYDKLANKNMLLQASSYSHYSWHLMARSASADGHGDLKGYLDERSGGFDCLAARRHAAGHRLVLRLRPDATLDQYEYILGATIGYDSSMSFQVSCGAAAAHPFTGEILDLIARYEKLRLSGRVPEAMKARLRIDPILGGVKKPEERAGPARPPPRLSAARARGTRGLPAGRVRAVARGEKPRRRGEPWTVRGQGAALPGSESRSTSSPGRGSPPGRRTVRPTPCSWRSFDDLAPYTTAPASGRDVRAHWAGEAGAVSPGVTQRLELAETGPGRETLRRLYRREHANGSRRLVGHRQDLRSAARSLVAQGRSASGSAATASGGLFKLQLCDAQGATDYYVTNDFVGWRYQQLARPEKDPIDYAKVRSLMFYYNGLPGKTTVACGIDDVKALRSLDTPVDRRSVRGDRRQALAWKGTLNDGQYLFFWPGEPVDPLRPAAQGARAIRGGGSGRRDSGRPARGEVRLCQWSGCPGPRASHAPTAGKASRPMIRDVTGV